MDILSNFEKDQKLLNELRELLIFAPPGKLRRGLTDLFFHYFTDSDDPGLPNQREFTEHFYYLINFLNEIEDHLHEQWAKGKG